MGILGDEVQIKEQLQPGSMATGMVVRCAQCRRWQFIEIPLGRDFMAYIREQGWKLVMRQWWYCGDCR